MAARSPVAGFTPVEEEQRTERLGYEDSRRRYPDSTARGWRPHNSANLFHTSSLSLAMLLRPDHGLRAPPAPARASVSAAAIPAVSRLPRGALRLPRAASPLRGKTSSALRASAGMPSVAHREVARAVAEEAVARLGDRLLPSAVPADVAEFSNGDGTALGAPDSPIDFMLQSALHCSRRVSWRR
ncbi:red chlorophyll catabolite reductase 1, chloroplastic-like [Triticum aestivum]|uniref:red chlorophyll catabolite reductase 1, chloroplastic-like n=1 Tax=Triticum aestivum TaxID=4565 RepID=UPI001D030DBD|nr:red chlorophyll catabolite reductase 1, chloroplastic-like [Triticum aestivum]